jgi:hypothetical protein
LDKTKYPCLFVAEMAKLRPNKKRFKRMYKIIHFPKRVFWAFLLEGMATSKMLHTFLREGRGRLLVSSSSKNPTPEEMAEAMEQLKDLPRFLPFFVVVIVPVPGVTEGYTIMAITLEKWLGHKVKLLPSEFRKLLGKEEPPPVQE